MPWMMEQRASDWCQGIETFMMKGQFKSQATCRLDGWRRQSSDAAARNPR